MIKAEIQTPQDASTRKAKKRQKPVRLLSPRNKGIEKKRMEKTFRGILDLLRYNSKHYDQPKLGATEEEMNALLIRWYNLLHTNGPIIGNTVTSRELTPKQEEIRVYYNDFRAEDRGLEFLSLFYETNNNGEVYIAEYVIGEDKKLTLNKQNTCTSGFTPAEVDLWRNNYRPIYLSNQV